LGDKKLDRAWSEIWSFSQGSCKEDFLSMGGVVSSNFGSGVSSTRISFEWSYGDHPFEIKKKIFMFVPFEIPLITITTKLRH
jgi:hypothetical protein